MRMALIACVLAAACGSSQTAAPTPQGRADATPAVSTDPLAFMPPDADLLIRIDFATLRKSPLWPKYVGHVNDAFLAGFRSCGYDPLADVTLITAGVPVDTKLGVFVMRGLDRDKMLACLRTAKFESTTVTFDEDIITLTNKSGAVNMGKFVDRSTLVMHGSTGPTKKTLQAALAIKTPLRDHAGVALVESMLPAGSGLSVLVAPGSRMLGMVSDRLGSEAKHVYASISATDKVMWRAGIALATRDAAAETAGRLRALLDQMSSFAERADVQVSGELVTMDVTMAEAQLQTLIGLVLTQAP